MSDTDFLIAHVLFAAHFGLAAVGFFLLGRMLLSKVPSRFPLVFTAVYAGQMFAWFGSYLVLPVNAGLAGLLGVSLPLPLCFWLVVGGSGFAIARRRGRGLASLASLSLPPAPMLLLLAGAAGGMWLVCGAYSSHLGALGLDTHQHIYWTNQLLDAGHVPLVFRHTEALASYPKAFHLLAALWVGAGGGALVGPFVKVMPFVQSFLPCLVLVELLIARSALEERDKGEQALLGFILTSLLLAYSFAWSAMVYPEADLNSTPRQASNALLLLPALLTIAARIFDSPRLAAGALLSLPPVAGLALALNAVVTTQLVAFMLPLFACLGGFSLRSLEALPRRALLFACALPLLIVLSDPFVVSLWTRAMPGVGESYLSLLGVSSQEQMTSLGVMSGADFIEEAASDPTHAGFVEILGLGLGSVVDGLVGWFAHTGASFPLLQDLHTDLGRGIVRGLVLVLALVALVRMRGGPKRSEGEGDRFAFRLWWGVALGVTLGALGQVVLWRFVTGLAIGRGYAFELLRDYSEASALHVSLVAGAFVLIVTANWAVAGGRLPGALARRLATPALTGVAALLLVLAPFGLHRLLPEVGAERMFWSRVDADDLEALELVEAAIEDWEVVVVPAEVWKIGPERWIIPQGETASLLPFTRSRVLFNSRLGYGANLNWRDLARFCNASPGGRREFLRAHDVSWVLIKSEGSGLADFPRRFGLCGATLSSLGAEFPPAQRRGDLSLYRLAPAD